MASECLACDPRHEGKPCRFRLAQEALVAAHQALGGEAGAVGHQHVQARGQRPNLHALLWMEIFDGDAGEDGAGAGFPPVRSVGQLVGPDDDLTAISAMLAAEWADKIGAPT